MFKIERKYVYKHGEKYTLFDKKVLATMRKCNEKDSFFIPLKSTPGVKSIQAMRARIFLLKKQVKKYNFITQETTNPDGVRVFCVKKFNN